MPGVPSNKACDRCKKRHVKCDEGRPECQRCIAAGVNCPGYSQDRKFIDQGATVRRRYAPYQREEARNQSLARNTATPGNDEEGYHVQPVSNQEMPETEGSFSQDSGSRDSRIVQTNNQMNRAGSERLETTFGNTMSPPSETDLATAAPYTGPGVSTDFLDSQPTLPNIPSTGNLAYPNTFGIFDPMQSPNLYNSSAGAQTGLDSTLGANYAYTLPEASQTARNVNTFGDFYSELMINSEREVAFLKRHYVECIAPWFDLHDSEKLFSGKFLRRSTQVPLMHYAILAIAAKHLARMNGAKPLLTSTLNPATTEIYPNATQVDWLFKATNYYYQALFHMKQLALGQADFQQLDATNSPIYILCQDLGIDQSSEKSQRSTLPSTFISNIDDIYPALVILTVFDIFDRPGTEWETRFFGLNSLTQSIIYLPRPQNHILTMSHAVLASFWNFAYLEVFASYANRRRTCLDAYNFDFFRAAGLSIDDRGRLDLNALNDASTMPSTSKRDEMSFRGMTFLILKLMNFIAEFKEFQQKSNATSSPIPDFLSNTSVPQSSGLGAKWYQLVQEVGSWHDSLPETFMPYIRLESPHDLLSPTTSSSSLPFPEIVFSNATHASTVVLYNFARIILLLNRPYDSQSTARDRLVEYREITKEVDSCTREIAGIAMGRTATAVQLHLVQPLFVVGLCDDRPEARNQVVELMRGIRAQIGWETEYKITQLHALWNKTFPST